MSPVLVTITVCCALETPTGSGSNTRPVAPVELRVSAAVPTTPVPDRLTEVAGARKLVLLFTDKLPVIAPFCVGRNEIITVQVLF